MEKLNILSKNADNIRYSTKDVRPDREIIPMFCNKQGLFAHLSDADSRISRNEGWP